MKRTFWLAFGFLIIMCALAAFKVSIATPAKQQETFAANTVGLGSNEKPLTKADRLEMSSVDEASDKKVVRLIPISLSKAVQPEPREQITKIISRHWHQGNSKIKIKRPALNRRHAASAKYRS